jgi:Family of unknown function (DUF6502)
MVGQGIYRPGRGEHVSAEALKIRSTLHDFPWRAPAEAEGCVYSVSHMEEATPRQASAAARQWLRPAIHVLLRCGVTWREFAELAKSVYVEVATDRFGKKGRPTNVSRTAMLTGLPRRDVRKQRERLAEADPGLTGYVTKGSLLLTAWHLDAEYLDGRGKPRALPLEGEHRSFTSLLKRCGAGDVRPITLLKELVSAGAVRWRSDGRLQVLQRHYIPHAMDAELLRLWGTVLADVAMTCDHNLTHGPKVHARFERAAVNDRVSASSVAEFQKFLEREGQAFLERVDAWLTAHQAADEQEETSTDITRLGAGVYHIQD